ncbi:MAG: ABC transporter ATP-binding protein [Ectothiorhodospiraceae bacterium]|nr:ABC transporter ATP-binding protein [Ectothiorhodospiraceae bacterium]
MSDTYLLFTTVSFGYEHSLETIINGLTAHCAPGWTGIVGANGSGKSTLLRLAAGELTPSAGTIQSSGSVVYCPQRTDTAPDNFNGFMTVYDKPSMRLKAILEIEEEWLYRWETLSQGERKRAQIAVAIWQEPDVLLLDEPTNHLDADSLRVLYSALEAFNGTGLLVSHDRFLLNTLCYQCAFFEPPRIVMRSGTYAQGKEQQNIEYDSTLKMKHEAESTLQSLNREVTRRRNAADRADSQRSKRHLKASDHDAKAKIDLARVSGKDGAAGRRLRQLQGRVAQAEQTVESIDIKGRRVTGIEIPSEKSKRDTLFTLEPHTIPLGTRRMLRIPEISMAPSDRVAISGKNGCGKSTFIRFVVERLRIAPEKIVYIPQEVDDTAAKRILAEVRSLPNEVLGQLFTIVSRLGSEPKHLLDSDMPSPGEIRKLMLAHGMLHRPQLIIMDEPTNHMDLPSIECLEEALAECACGLLLVSHDEDFLRAVSSTHWQIVPDSTSQNVYSIHRQM